MATGPGGDRPGAQPLRRLSAWAAGEEDRGRDRAVTALLDDLVEWLRLPPGAEMVDQLESLALGERAARELDAALAELSAEG